MAEPNAVEHGGLRCAVHALVLACSVAAATALLPPAGIAATLPTGEAIDLTADLVSIDSRNDIHELSGNVRISQGEMSMEADKATARAMQTDHSHWTFDRSVKIRTADANLTSDSASATFANGQIAAAVAKGQPATFEQRNASAEKKVRGRANTIEYDFDKGTVKLTDNVWFSQGGNEFRGDTLIYYVRDERVVMNPGGKQSGRVNITIRPRQNQDGTGKSTATKTPAGKPGNGA